MISRDLPIFAFTGYAEDERAKDFSAMGFDYVPTVPLQLMDGSGTPTDQNAALFRRLKCSASLLHGAKIAGNGMLEDSLFALDAALQERGHCETFAMEERVLR